MFGRTSRDTIKNITVTFTKKLGTQDFHYDNNKMF